MKKRCIQPSSILLFLFCLLTCIILIPSLSLALTGQQEHERIEENVTVVNVEVPVRVLFKGMPVNNLTKEDFTIYEGNKKVDINGFFIKRKKITMSLAEETGTGTGTQGTAVPAPARTFVLIFNITDYNDSFKGAVDYLFEKVLREQDHVLIFANDSELNFAPLKDKAQAKTKLQEALKLESQKARARLIQYISKMETFLATNDFRMDQDNDPLSTKEKPQKLIDFLSKVQVAWVDYRKQYLTPRVDRFYYFSRYLEKVKTEKWVLNFYQFELFPSIRIGSDTMHKMRELAESLINSSDGAALAQGRQINTILNELIIDFNINKTFPNEEVTKLFYKVDATFHSFFIKSTSQSLSSDFEYREVSSDLENLLKGITDATGGQNFTTNDVKAALQQVKEFEDVYYILTYVPRDPKKKGELKIKVNKKKHKVLYDNNFREDYIQEYFKKLEIQLQTPDIKIGDVSFKQRALKFTINHYLVRQVDNVKIGRFKVRIRMVNADGNEAVFDQEKILTASKIETSIALPPQLFAKISKGEYNLLIDVKDMFTGKEDTFHQVTPVK